MRFATWNVNSVRTRLKHVVRFLEEKQPDVVLLQETKCEAASFPALEFRALDYRTEAIGQKTYNGVAVLSRSPFSVKQTSLAGHENEARYLEIDAGGTRLIDVYVPNGNSGGEKGFARKLNFLAELALRLETLLAADEPVAVAGDFNVCPSGVDLAEGTVGPDDALVRPESRAAFRRLLWLGTTDAVRALRPTGPAYTFWDYQAGAFDRDCGMRIDHVLLSPALAERLARVEICRSERARDQPSDHVPVLVELA